jgi:hypothetical protein
MIGAFRWSRWIIPLVVAVLILAYVTTGRGNDNSNLDIHPMMEVVSNWMKSLPDDAPPEHTEITRSMSLQERTMTDIRNKLQRGAGGNSQGLAAMSLASSLLQWTAERNLDKPEHLRAAAEYERITSWSATLPPGSPGQDVWMLTDKKTGLVTACFTVEYWHENHEKFQASDGPFPKSLYELKTQDDSSFFNFVNYTHISPLGDSTSHLLRDTDGMGPIISSDETLRKHFQTYLAPGRESSGLETYWAPSTEFDKSEIKVTPEAFRQEMDQMKSMGESIVSYEDAIHERSSGSIGGIALGGSATFPTDRRPELVYSVGGKLYGRSAGQDIEFEDIDPSEFAVLLRATALGGQAPILTIGTEPSDRSGYMKVTYSPGIHNTTVGASMMYADQRLKGLMLDIGLGKGGTSTGEQQVFFSSFPAISGHALRLWFTNIVAEFDQQDSRFVVRSPSLRLNYEEIMRDEPVRDSNLDQFMNEFERRLQNIEIEVPEFARLEKIARTAALARWVAESNVIVSPGIWVLPFDPVLTPEYVRATSDGRMYSGGVDFSGRNTASFVSLGGLMPLTLESQITGQPPHGVGPVPYELVLAILLSAGAIWVLISLFRRFANPIKFRSCIKVWVTLLVSLFILDTLASTLLFPYLLNEFDSEFLSFLLVVAAPAFILRLLLDSKLIGAKIRPVYSAGTTWLAFPAIGFVAVLVLGLLSAATTRTIVSSGLASRAGLQAFNVSAAPAEIVSKSWASGGGAEFQFGIRFFPASVVRSTFYRFILLQQEIKDETDYVMSTGSIGPIGLVEMQRVHAPGLVAPVPIYTIDGQPPY